MRRTAIKRFNGRYTKKNTLKDWSLTNESGLLASAAEKLAAETVLFVLNKCTQRDDDGMTIYMPAAFESAPFKTTRRKHIGVDAVRFSLGITSGSVLEPYFEVSISDLVSEFLSRAEEGWGDQRQDLKKKLLAAVAAIDKSLKKHPQDEMDD